MININTNINKYNKIINNKYNINIHVNINTIMLHKMIMLIMLYNL